MRIGPGELWHKVESRCGKLRGKEVGPGRVTVWQFVIVEEVLSEEIENVPRGSPSLKFGFRIEPWGSLAAGLCQEASTPTNSEII